MLASLIQQGHMWYGEGHMMGMHWGWWIFWLAVVAFLIWLVTGTTGASQSGTGTSPPTFPRKSAEEALRERIAKGELSEEEFRKRLQVLREAEGGGA